MTPQNLLLLLERIEKLEELDIQPVRNDPSADMVRSTLDTAGLDVFTFLRTLRTTSEIFCALFLRCPKLERIHLEHNPWSARRRSCPRVGRSWADYLGDQFFPVVRILEADLDVGLRLFSRCPNLEELYLPDQNLTVAQAVVLLHLPKYELPRLRILEARYDCRSIILRFCPLLKDIRFESEAYDGLSQLPAVST